jgi:RNA polymerase sigma-70 factor (ECF subfamily)
MQTDLDRARRGDLGAFNRLVAAHQAQLYTLSYRALGDEQAAVEAVQAAVGRARAEVGRLSAGDWSAKLQVWLLRKAIAACQERFSAPVTARARPAAGTSKTTEPPLQRGLCHLPLDLRLAVLLVDVTGLGYAEAAEVLDTSREQVSRRVAQARALLTEDMSAWASPSC